jgi:hypothetical protein
MKYSFSVLSSKITLIEEILPYFEDKGAPLSIEKSSVESTVFKNC